MKISTSQLFNQSVRDIQDNQSELSNTREKLATGKSLIRASDDTTKLTKVDTLERYINKSRGYENTLNVLTDRYKLEESVLSSGADILVRLKELAIQGSNNTLSAMDRDILATEVSSLRDELISIANTKDVEGNSIFAGGRTESTAFLKNVDSTVTYVGDTRQNTVYVSDTRELTKNRNGLEIFSATPRSTEYLVTGTSRQALAAAADVALPGSIGTYDPSNSGLLAINGSLANAGSVSFPAERKISVSSVTDETLIKFTVVGTDKDGNAQQEEITGGNNTTVSGVKSFKTITSVTASAAVTGKVELGPEGPLNTTTKTENVVVSMDSSVKTIQVADNDSAKEVAAKINAIYAGGGVDGIGTYAASATGALAIDGVLAASGIVELSSAQPITVTSAADESLLNFTVTGTDENGNPMTEVIAGGNERTVSGNQFFKTITSISSDGIATGKIQVGTLGTDEPLLTAAAKTYAQLYSINKIDENYSLSINGTQTESFVLSATNINDAVAKINLISETTGVSAKLAIDGKILLTDADGDDFTIENTATGKSIAVQSLNHDGKTTAGNPISLGPNGGNDSTRVMGSIETVSPRDYTITQSGNVETGYFKSQRAGIENVGFFEVLEDFKKALISNDLQTVERAVSEIGGLHNGIARAIGKVGSEIRNSETQLDINLDGRLRLEQLLSGEKDLDYSEAVTQFNAEIARLEAAQAAFAKISQLSLFEYI
ncbi:flagellar hook-associated protein FlgL [Gammaproteobacteria bacterium]|nr:flagellar hook-associated protein FlgL [Gammaproteobacteria bacterium]